MSENDKPIEENNLVAHEEDQAPRQITFEYNQSNSFRVVHVEGATASVTPKADINISFWSEHHSIPLAITYEVSPEGALGREIERITRNTIVREIEVSMSMSIDTARSIIELLETVVKQAVTQIKQIQDKQGQGE